jgi:hypothetical protein
MTIDAHATTDHEKIRRWTEQHGGHPAKVSDKASGNRAATELLYVNFPGTTERPPYIEQVSWNEWFALFENHGLAFRVPDSEDAITYQLVPRSARVASPRSGRDGGTGV